MSLVERITTFPLISLFKNADNPELFPSEYSVQSFVIVLKDTTSPPAAKAPRFAEQKSVAAVTTDNMPLTAILFFKFSTSYKLFDFEVN